LRKVLFYVRHGENRANITREFSYKKIDYPLTERGIAQAESTASYLKQKGICAIYSSPMKRALETAEIIGKRLDLVPFVIEELREVNVGILDGELPTKENLSIHDRVTKDWLIGNSETRFPGGENLKELLSRAGKALSQIIESSDACQNIAVVSHGGLILYAFPLICNNAENFDLGTVENCSISSIEFEESEDGQFHGKILSWGSSDHLGSLNDLTKMR